VAEGFAVVGGSLDEIGGIVGGELDEGVGGFEEFLSSWDQCSSWEVMFGATKKRERIEERKRKE
jgi:hypothetical protein